MRRRIALTVAGSDPAGGAGIQGDLRAFAARGVHGLSALTAIIAQGTRGVRAVWPVDAARVREQIEVVLDDITADAAKTGALCTAAIVAEVATAMDQRSALPLIVDPVISSSSGAPLLDEDGVRLLRDRLVPRATLITPNVSELRILLGERADARDADSLARAAERLIALGARAVLAKGGHLEGEPIDILIDERGEQRFSGNRIVTECTRGTGCTLSAAITAGIARGESLSAAIIAARSLLRRAMERATPIGQGSSPLDLLAAHDDDAR
jgi:hydroxymethylpyrimidine kinase/phosphomethylpyrimidine kinase